AGDRRPQRRAPGGLRQGPQRSPATGQHPAVQRRAGRRRGDHLGTGRAFPRRLPGRHGHRAASRRQPCLPGRRRRAGGTARPRPRRAAAQGQGRAMSRQHKAWLLPVSVVAALLLGLLPLPAWMQPFRPYWLALVLVYWLIETPDRTGIGFAFIVGLAADLAFGTLLGEQALRLT